MKTMKRMMKILALLLIVPLFLTACWEDIEDISNAIGEEPITYAVGDIGPSGVGKVFYVTDGGLHGLEAAPVDQSTSILWAVMAYDDALVNGISPLPSEIGYGSANTDAIIAQHSGEDMNTYAAGIARSYDGGGKNDWYLPSKDELDILYTNKGSVGGFSNERYWSSSEWDNFKAWYQYFSDGFQDHWLGKNDTFRVRAIRAF